MIQLFESRGHRARLDVARTFVTSYAAGTELLLVGSTRESVDDFVRGEIATPGATFGLHRFSWMQLTSHLAAGAMASRDYAPATMLGIEAVAARAAYEARERNEMPRLEPVARYPRFPRALASTLNELRLADTDASDTPDDISALLRHYETASENARIADQATLLRLACSSLAGNEHAGLRRMPILLLDVALRTPLECQLVAELCRESPRVLATLPAGDARSRDALHELGAQQAPATGDAQTPVASDRGGHEARDPTTSPAISLSRVRTHLFAETPPLEGEPDESVRFFSAPGEGRECVEIARQVIEEAKRGVRFDEIAIVLRAPEVYSAFLDTALRRAGIPSWFARGTRRPDAAGRAFLALLACRCEGLSARRFAEYLSFAQVPQPDSSGAPPPAREAWVPAAADELGVTATPESMRTKGVESPTAENAPVQLTLWDLDAGDPADPKAPAPTSDDTTRSAENAARSTSSRRSTHTEPAGATTDDDSMRHDTDAQPAIAGTLRAPWRWEELLVEAAVIGGKDRWRRRLQGLAYELRLQMNALQDTEPESARLPALQRDLTNLGHLERYALPIIEELDAWPQHATWGDWMVQLIRLVPIVLRRPDRVLAVLAEMQPMATIGPVTLDEVRTVLTERLALLEQSPAETRYGRVFVATPDHLRGRSFRVVFIPGLAERLFPQRPREDPLLLDAQRERISPHLTTQVQRSREERLRLEIALGAAEERAVLSYPRLDAVEARPRVPSFYALDMARAVRGVIPDFEVLEREAAARVQARLAWPSPREASSAIDTIEHDLAVLGSFLHADDRSQSRGRARYLLHLSPDLARSLRARWLRWSSTWRPQDGLVRTNAITEPLFEAQRPTARPYSVTALQKFAACPYQFVLAAIHRLAPRRDAVPIVQLDPLTRGRIFHHAQSEVLRRLRDANALTAAGANVDKVQDVLDRTLERLAAAYRDDLMPAIERIWDDEIDTMRADLRRWLRRLLRESSTWRPLHFELTFGLGSLARSAPSRSEPGGRAGAAAKAFTERGSPEPVRLPDGYLLRGAVDLVEENAREETLRITDHKTGRNRTAVGMIVGGGEVLQPVLYALAVGQLLQRDVSEGRLYFCTSRGGFTERVVPIGDFARLYARTVLETLDRSVEKGFLPPAPRRDACTFCDFRVVCGPHEEIRSRRKSAATLHYLDELRSLP